MFQVPNKIWSLFSRCSKTSPAFAIRVKTNAEGNIATVATYHKMVLRASTSINLQKKTRFHNMKKYLSNNMRV